MTLRSAMLTLHKYAGLFLGLVLAVTGVSGSVLVFDHAIDEALTPATVTPDDPARRAPLEDVLTAADEAVGGKLEAYRIYIARRPGSPHVVRYRDPDAAGPLEVSVAPATAEVLAVRTWGDYPASWVYNLHYNFFAGNAGKTFVGILGIVLLFFCLSGVIIWWPRPGRWRRAFTIRLDRGAYNFNFDLHRTTGLYLLPLLAVVAFSGVALVFRGPMTSLVESVVPVEEYPAPRSRPGDSPITVDAAVAAGKRVFPDAELKRVHLPAGPDGTFHLFFKTPSEPWSAYAASAAWIDPWTGEVLDAFDVSEASAGSRFMSWQFPLHNGDALGLAGRWLVFVTGLLPALLFGTGLYTWLRKRRNLGLQRATTVNGSDSARIRVPSSSISRSS